MSITTNERAEFTAMMNKASDESESLRAENTHLINKITAMHNWLAANQPDVFKRGIWTSIDAMKADQSKA